MWDVLRQNHDVIVFDGCWIIIFICLDLWLRRPERQGQIRLRAWFLLALVLVSGWFIVQEADRRERGRLRYMIEGVAPTYAQELELMGHARIGLDTKPDDSDYLRMIEAEKRWLKLNPRVDDIYTLRKLPDGRNVFIVDSETDYNRNGRYDEEREQRTSIGEVYTEQDEGIEKAFRGEANFEDVPTTDRWGTWVSAAVPMYEGSRVEAVLGVDFDAHEWQRSIAQHRLMAIVFLSIILAIFATSVAIISFLRSHIRQREKVEGELLKAKLVADSANRAKGEFLANMSHEIRTPLNGVIGMVNLLKETDLKPAQRELLQGLKDSADFLSGLLNDILDLSKIEAGKLNIDAIPFHLRECLEGTLKNLSVRVGEKHLKLFLEVDPAVNVQLVGDPSRLRQVLTNLVGNAIKFTEEGEVAVRVTKEVTSSNASGDASGKVSLLFRVSDTGIGISKEKQELLFQAFTQADDTIARQYGGTGLGLAIASRLVSLMGGAIGFESEVGKGSVFFFTIPFQASDVAIHPPVQKNGSTWRDLAAGQRPLRVLLGEDNLINQKVAARLLEKAGHEVTLAADGEELLMEWEKNRSRYDLILMDVQMPRMDGLVAARKIRAKEKGSGRRIPIIALTAYSMKGDQERCLEVGMDHYLSKPLEPEQLMKAISKLVLKPVEAATHSNGVIDREALMKRVDHDVDLLKHLVVLFHEESPRLMKEIREAIQKKDREALVRASHTIKGAIGNFCSATTFKEAARMEEIARFGDMTMAETELPRLADQVVVFEKALEEITFST